MSNMQQASERKARIECLKLAVQIGDPDRAMMPEEVIARAETLFRYVVNGPTSNNVLKAVK